MSQGKSIWRKKVDLQAMNSLCEGSLVSQTGIRFTEVGANFVVATMPVDERTIQPYGLLHGGATAALIETLASVASTWSVSDEKICVGVELHVSHLRPVREGIVQGKATPIRIGETLHVWNVDVTDEKGRLSATGRLTLAVKTL